MIQTLTIKNTISHMYDTLMSDGVFKIDHYVTGDDLQQLHDETQEKCENEAGHYEFGRNYCGPSLNNFNSDSAIFKVYDAHWMRCLHRKYSNSGEYGQNVYATHDYKFDGELARNGWLHFDRGWRLKFFIYLTDIDESSGAFNCSVGSRPLGGQLRNSAWVAKDYGGVKNRIELDYPELLKKWPCEPVEAPAGTLIVFDTDTFHKGGKCDQGKERLIVRLHCG